MLRHVKNASPYDILGENTYFREVCNTIVGKVVSAGKWFRFCSGYSEQVDILKIENDKGKAIKSYLSDLYPETDYKPAMYKYLLRDYLCYYEVPAVKKSYNSYKYVNSYNRYLITSNINVVSEWLGITVGEASEKYGAYLGDPSIDTGDSYVRYVKLAINKDGTKRVICPRTQLDLSILGTRVYPVFALEKALRVLYDLLENDTYNVSFYKDSGQIRVINLTNSYSILQEYYPEAYLDRYFMGAFRGELLDNPYLDRGYINVFEVGASKYDVPTRKVSYARITTIEKAEPNLAYVDIDLTSVLETFNTYILSSQIDIHEFVNALENFDVGTERTLKGKPLESLLDIDTWVNEQKMLLGTDLERQLAIFMLGNPQWFEGYTGALVENTWDTPLDTSSFVTDTLDFSF